MTTIREGGVAGERTPGAMILEVHGPDHARPTQAAPAALVSVEGGRWRSGSDRRAIR